MANDVAADAAQLLHGRIRAPDVGATFISDTGSRDETTGHLSPAGPLSTHDVMEYTVGTTAHQRGRLRKSSTARMHDTADALGSEFFRVYLGNGPARILDVGSRDINGTLRSHAPPGSTYTGVDIEAGPGVDIVLEDPYSLPFEEDAFDAVVSTSCFEHDQMFWLTFGEMVRVTRQGGHIYINAPSNGTYHAYPFDNWRFYPDSGKALVAWARRCGYPIVLVESFIATRLNDIWNDCVMVFRKGNGTNGSVVGGIVDAFPRSYNIRRSNTDEVANLTELTEDVILLHEAQAAAQTKIDAQLKLLAESEAATASAREEAEAERAALAENTATLTAANESLQAELTRSRETSARLEAEAREHATAEYNVRGDLERLKKSADRIERQRREETATLAAALAEIAAQRTRLNESDAAVADARREATAQQAELAALRTRLDESEGKVCAQADAAAKLQGEIHTLHDELAASREVGRAMAAAFRADLGAPLPEAESRPGWWRGVLRRIGVAPIPA